MSISAKIKKTPLWEKARPQELGFAGGMALIAAYFILLTVLNSFDHAIDQFFGLWYWILALAAGFGIQIGLYTYLKQRACSNTAVGTEIAATGGVSAGSMLGCCAHHITDFAPLLGLSAATIFLTRYQTSFMVLGVASNIIGVTIMLNAMQKHNLFDKKGSLKTLFKYDMKVVRSIAIILAIVIVALSFYTQYKTNNSYANTTSLSLDEKTDDQNGVTISAKPVDFSFGNQVKFSITLTTHQGSLDHDLTKVSLLTDASGNAYQPVSWEGSPPGGHHRSGVLTFPALNGKTSSMKLIIKGIYNVPQRTFEWIF